MTKNEAAVVGIGSLGRALLSRYDPEIVVGVTRQSEDYLTQVLQSRILLLCMKQGDILDWLDTYSSKLDKEQSIVSFGAALHFETLARHNKAPNHNIIRAMTNRGIGLTSQEIVWSSQNDISIAQKLAVSSVLDKVGESRFVGVGADEQIDKATHKACDMGRIAFILAHYQFALIKGLRYEENEARESIIQSLQAILDSLKNKEGLGEIAKSVASPGGITEASNNAMIDYLVLALEAGMEAADDKMAAKANEYK